MPHSSWRLARLPGKNKGACVSRLPPRSPAIPPCLGLRTSLCSHLCRLPPARPRASSGLCQASPGQGDRMGRWEEVAPLGSGPRQCSFLTPLTTQRASRASPSSCSGSEPRRDNVAGAHGGTGPAHGAGGGAIQAPVWAQSSGVASHRSLGHLPSRLSFLVCEV